MKFDTNEFLRKTMSLGDFNGHVFQEKRKRVICKDGFSISIQAGEYYYCEPRLNFVYEYKSVELGFPSEEDELINKYAEDENYTRTVYPMVPVEIVNELINKHGGVRGSDNICGMKTFVDISIDGLDIPEELFKDEKDPDKLKQELHNLYRMKDYIMDQIYRLNMILCMVEKYEERCGEIMNKLKIALENTTVE